MFEQELKTLKENLPSLKQVNPQGGFVVIKDKEILGVWLNRQDALKQGIEKYGNQPFLVRDINEQNTVLNFSKPLVFGQVGT